MENKEALDTLHDIKELMEKSTKFMSISGISAILVGIYACIGTGLAYFILNKQDSFDTLFNIPLLNINTTYQLASICLIALGVLALSLLRPPFTLELLSSLADRGNPLFLFNLAAILRINLFHNAHFLRVISRELFQIHLFGHTLLRLRRDTVRPR